jgi:ketosteroid isomerase-like protein
MKPGISCVFATCLCAAAFAPAQSSNPSVAQHILPLLHEQEVAANAHDTDRFLATYLHDPSLVFIFNGQIIQGFDTLHKQQLKWWKSGKSDVVYTEQAQPDIVALDARTALVTQRLASHRTMPGGSPHDDRFVVTSIWKKLPAGWRVTYCHESHTP